MSAQDKKSSLHREAEHYTQEQMRLLLSVRDIIKEEVKREVAKQLEQYKK